MNIAFGVTEIAKERNVHSKFRVRTAPLAPGRIKNEKVSIKVISKQFGPLAKFWRRFWP